MKSRLDSMLDTWTSVTYSISSRSSILLDYVSIVIDNNTGLPYVSKVYQNSWKEIGPIKTGDIVFCINDTFFTNAEDLNIQKEILRTVLDAECKRFSLRLIDRERFIEHGIPRIEQVIISDRLPTIQIKKYQSSEYSCISTISSKLFSSLAGSVLLAVNSEIVINKTPESLDYLLHNSVAPLVLLIACPYMQQPISRQEILEYMSNNDIMTVNSSSFRNTGDEDSSEQRRQSRQSEQLEIERLSHLVIPEKGTLASSELKDSFSNQQNYTQCPYAVDTYMFPQSQGYAILEKQWMQSNKQRWEKNEQAWKEFLQGIGGASNLSFGWTRQSGKKWSLSLSSEVRQRNKLRSLVHEGIPAIYRPSVWFHLSGGKELRERSPNTFAQLYESQMDPHIKDLIESDISRTFPTHPLFCKVKKVSEDSSEIWEEAPYVSSLRRILLALSVISDDIPYCQGMNLLAAFLLVVVTEEETVFWTLAAILQFTFPPHYFDETLSGARIDAELFSKFAREDFPELVSSLEKFDEHILSISLSWFLNMFINTLPTSSVVRVWDVVLLEGDKALMRIALALLAMNNDYLLSIEDESERALMFRQMGILQFDVDTLLDTAFPNKKVPFIGRKLLKYSRSEIHDLRQKKREEMAKTDKLIDSDEDSLVF